LAAVSKKHVIRVEKRCRRCTPPAARAPCWCAGLRRTRAHNQWQATRSGVFTPPCAAPASLSPRSEVDGVYAVNRRGAIKLKLTQLTILIIIIFAQINDHVVRRQTALPPPLPPPFQYAKRKKFRECPLSQARAKSRTMGPELFFAFLTGEAGARAAGLCQSHHHQPRRAPTDSWPLLRCANTHERHAMPLGFTPGQQILPGPVTRVA